MSNRLAYTKKVKKNKYKSPQIKTKKIKVNFFFSFDRVGDAFLGYCITGGGATCYPPSLSAPSCCTCFLRGTRILMGDNSYKEIQDIKVGERIVSFNTDKKETTFSKVDKVIDHPNTDGGYLVINNVLKVTSEHPLWSDSSWKRAGELKEGDLLLDQYGQEVEIKSIEKVDGVNTVYNLEVRDTHNYFAENLLVHNKLVT